MSRLTLRRKGMIRAAAISAVGLAGAVVPMSAFGQSLTINLQLAPGAAGASDTTEYLTPANNNTAIPVYVYATVTGTATSPNQAANGAVFNGLQYVYYNINSSGPPTGPGSILTGTASVPTTPNSDTFGSVTGGFNGGVEPGTGETSESGNGVQTGFATNAGGIAIGSTTAATAIAKPRSAAIIWNNSTPSVSTDSYTVGDSTSFLVETIMYTPTAFSPSSLGLSTPKNQTNLVASIPTAALAAADLVPANFWTDSTSTSSPTGFQNSATEVSGGNTVTFTDTFAGDLTGIGMETSAFLLTVIQNFNQPDTLWSQGDFDGHATVDSADLLTAIQDYQGNLGSGPLVVSNPAFFDDPQAVALAQSYGLDIVAAPAVPEPMSLSMLGLVGAAALTRRRRRS